MENLFLIADDSESKMLFLEGMLQHEKFPATILRAKTSEEAQEVILHHSDIAFAFIDYEIPSENGIAIIKALRGKNPKAKIALVTAYSNPKYKEEATCAGADAFVCTSDEEENVIEHLSDLLLEWSNS